MVKNMSENESAKKITNTSKATRKSIAKKAKPFEQAKPAAIVPASPVATAPAALKPVEVKAPVKAKATAAKVTTIVAKVDVGFGNTLFLRGTGPGLSWDTGIEMSNTGSDEWTWTTNKASDAFLAKVLINDVIWSGDPDTTIAAGEKTVITATF
jgi:hypothetical protein